MATVQPIEEDAFDTGALLPVETKKKKIISRESVLPPDQVFRRAAQVGDVETMQFMLSKGDVAVNEADDGTRESDHPNPDETRHLTGNTALHVAAEFDVVDAAEHLCMSGADIEKRNRIGSTALHKCCSEGNLNVATLLLDKFKADIHAKNKVGNTPLHCAVYSAHLAIVKKLLECGAGTDVLVNNLVGMTPLDYAFNPDIRHLLESYVAKEKKSEQ